MLPVLLAGAVAFGTACDGDDDPGSTSPTDDSVVTEIGRGDAIVALVQWHVGDTEPVVDDAGDEVLPVVYVASDSGDTIDVGLQAAVAERTVDDAVVRFADERAEAIEEGVDGDPVKDDGVLLVLGEMPEPGPSMTFAVTRYRTVDDEETLDVEVTATDTGADVTATPATPN